MIKSGSKLVHNIYNLPQLAKLNSYDCFDKFRERIGESSSGIVDIFYKNRTIYIAVNHPAFKMELNYLADEVFKELFAEMEECHYLRDNSVSCRVILKGEIPEKRG